LRERFGIERSAALLSFRNGIAYSRIAADLIRSALTGEPDPGRRSVRIRTLKPTG